MVDGGQMSMVDEEWQSMVNEEQQSMVNEEQQSMVLRDYLGLQQPHKTVLKHLAHVMNWHHDNLGMMTN